MKFPDEVLDDATRLHKSVVIAKSGIYKYTKEELGGFSGLNREVPFEHQSRSIFNVFRPPEVLDAAQTLFIRQPLTVEHPSEFITPDNFKRFAVGWTGDTVTVEPHRNKHDVVIRSSVNLLDKEALKAYESEIREVSPGYKATFEWQNGITEDGIEYQIIMKEITEVNHLALTEAGRGGKDASIIDHKGEKAMDVLKELKKLLGVKERILDSLPRNGEYSEDEKGYLFREVHNLLNHIADGKRMDSFKPEGFEKDSAHEKEGKEEKEEVKEEKKAEVAIKKAESINKEEEAEHKKEETDDTMTTEEEKGFGENESHPEEKEKEKKVEKKEGDAPVKKVADSKPGSQIKSVSSVSDSVTDSVMDFDTALRTGKLHNFLKRSGN